jgi:hypothetical protein
MDQNFVFLLSMALRGLSSSTYFLRIERILAEAILLVKNQKYKTKDLPLLYWKALCQSQLNLNLKTLTMTHPLV